MKIWIWNCYIYYPVVYTPGYYTFEKVYYLESNFYDLASDKLLWSVQQLFIHADQSPQERGAYKEMTSRHSLRVT
jgi:hypothetical protein